MLELYQTHSVLGHFHTGSSLASYFIPSLHQIMAYIKNHWVHLLKLISITHDKLVIFFYVKYKLIFDHVLTIRKGNIKSREYQRWTNSRHLTASGLRNSNPDHLFTLRKSKQWKADKSLCTRIYFC